MQAELTPPAWQRPHPGLVLASASSTRQALLKSVGLSFEVAHPQLDEAVLKAQADCETWTPSQLALSLAEAKACAVASARGEAIIIGADQVLTVGSARFDKPVDSHQAREQLGRLRGSTQHLLTAVVLVRQGRLIWRHLSTSVLTMRRSSDEFLDFYVASEGQALLSCVGACRLEGQGQLLIETIQGEHSAMLGLPLIALLDELRRLDVIMG